VGGGGGEGRTDWKKRKKGTRLGTFTNFNITHHDSGKKGGGGGRRGGSPVEKKKEKLWPGPATE